MISFYYSVYLFLLSALLSYDNSLQLLSKMFDREGWKVVSSHSDSLTVYKKNITDIPIPAFKATMITSVPMEYVISAILDGENHEDFMGSSHVIESEFVDSPLRDTTFVYQMLDLPIISNRHYITKNYNDTIKVDRHYRLNWLIDSRQNSLFFNDYIKNKNEEYGSPIFMENGAGSWEVEYLDVNKVSVSYIVLTDPGGWIPNRIISYVNKKLGPDTVIMMIEEGRRRYNNRK